MRRARILGHRPSAVAAVLLGLIFAACVGVSSVIGLAAWLAAAAFDWLWAMLACAVVAISITAAAWVWLHRHIFEIVPSASFAHGFDEGPWLSFRGDPRHSIVVNWFTKEDSASRVECGLRGASPGFVAGLPGRAHHVEIGGLEPGTAYSYRVLDFPKDGAFHGFKTAPASPEPFRFAVVGDTQNGGGSSPERWAYPPLLRAMAASGASLVAHAGDATDQGNDLVSWHEFLDASPRIIASIPLHVAAGNHDTGTHALADRSQKQYPDDGANYDFFFDYPYGTPRDEDEITAMRGRFFSFTYSNCLFVFVDTQTNRLANPRNPQWQWLRRVLGSAPAGVWKVVVMHRDAVSIKTRKDAVGYEMDYDKFAPYILPIFLEHDVDVVFQGHDHKYLHLAYQHGSNAPLPGADDGAWRGKVIHFVTSGAGGNLLRRNDPVLPESCTIPGFTRLENSSHFLVVDVHGDEMSIEARYHDGSSMERLSIKRPGI
ncbi:MAG: metallophosphoesterase family protein [Candidatus Lokiarchaeota archaeon]|nr:metallophosphoesterase family protein [Candidatus Lokiarchaeota archaeon]